MNNSTYQALSNVVSKIDKQLGKKYDSIDDMVRLQPKQTWEKLGKYLSDQQITTILDAVLYDEMMDAFDAGAL